MYNKDKESASDGYFPLAIKDNRVCGKIQRLSFFVSIVSVIETCNGSEYEDGDLNQIVPSNRLHWHLPLSGEDKKDF